jgi:F-type H+-transporting ATPase subunit gamma
MAERLADIVTQIQNVHQLGAVVTAMRGIAASRAQQGRSMLAGIEAYTEVISRAIGEALLFAPPNPYAASAGRSERRGVILFCAEQGFAGAFSQRVLDAAGALLERATILLLGTRGISIAGERGITIAWSSAMATHAGAVTDVANRVVEALYGRITEDSLSRVELVFARAASAGGVEVVRRSLLPLDFARFSPSTLSQPPLITLPPPILLERLAAEYVFAQLCEAAMHSFAAESEARMLAMASAKTNIDSKLASLAQRERQVRQQEITTEIVELAAGAEASQGSRR